ncbi:Uncharacterised protein [Vibrio cholerae]|nr:Uncharacterised protein [Vibrio cholerae]
MVTIVLLKDAWICATPSATCLRTRLRARVGCLAIVLYPSRLFLDRLTRTLTGASVGFSTLST